MNLSGWILVIYRVPSESSRPRVAVWRDLKRLGGLYLQQCVCLLPDDPGLAAAVERVRSRVEELGGSSTIFRLPASDPERDARLVDGFRDLAAKEYAEIVEECETKFVAEIESERARENYTFEEGEEIRHDLEKIRRWRDRAVRRDRFDAPGRDTVDAWIGRCQSLLDAFEEEVYARTGGGGSDIPSGADPAREPVGR